MEINEKEKVIQMKEDIINNLILTEYIDLKDEDLSKYKNKDIIKESLKTINNLEATLKQNKNSKKNVMGNTIISYGEEEEKEKEMGNTITPCGDENKKEKSKGNTITSCSEEGKKEKLKGNTITSCSEEEGKEKLMGNTIETSLDNKNILIKNKEKEKEKEIKIIRKTSCSSSLDENDILSNKDIPKKYLGDPIDFVDYLEYEQPKEKMKKIKNEFILKKYEEENNTKFEILNINVDKELNNVIFPENELLTLIYYYEDSLITGNLLGETKIYSLSDKKKLKTFPSPIKTGMNYQVTSLDITFDKRFIFIGYTNGNIAMFDLKSLKLKLLINNIIKNCECLCIKFINKEGKFIKIIVSDQYGNVFLIKIKDGMRGCRVVEKQKIYENKDYPIYFIRLIEFNDNFLKTHPFLKNLNKNIMFGSLQNIEIYSLIDFSKLTLKFKIERPEWINDYPIGDISFGIGKNPQSRESLGEDDDEPQILMCASFGNILNLYIIPIDNGELTMPIIIGHYFNINKNGNNQIIRIGFLSKGAVFLIDKDNYLKILNTRKFIKGNANINMDTLTPKNNVDYSITEIQEIYKFKSEINKQINLITPENNYKETFMNSIVENFDNKNIAILSNKCLYILELIHYEDCLRKLQKKEKWMDMLILGMEIYKGKITCLKGIPTNVEERKKKIRDFLQQLISVYIIADDMDQKNKYNKNNNIRRNSFYENQENLKHTENKIEIIIEFCSEIEGFDFLLDKILNMYEAKGYGDLFLSKLESFILCDKMLKYEINEDLILKLIQLYEDKKKTIVLNKLLLHIDIKSLCSPTVNSKIINDLKLLPPMINIFVNGNNPDYFKPIIEMYEIFQKAKSLNFNSYEKIIDTKNLSEIINSKEYKGHKILWYIKKCFIKRKYPYFVENMEEKEYEKYIMDLIFWLVKENIMKDLVKFDSENYFGILNRIFGDERNIDIINKYNSNHDNVKKKIRNLNEQSYEYAYKDLSPLNLANYIIDQGKKIKGNQKIQLDFNLFIVRSYKNTKIPKDIIMNTIIYILSDYSFVTKTPNENKTKKLILTIKNILNSEIFTESDYEKILLRFNDHIFDEIKIFINEKLKQYKKCLELYVYKDSKIYNKEEKLFNYIDQTLESFKNDKSKEKLFIDFKNLVLENMVEIGEISKDKMLDIIHKWFDEDINDKKKLIDILSKNPGIQFLYIELLSKEFIDNSKKDEENENDLLNQDKDFVTSTLGLYIELLCMLDKKEEVLKKLKQCYLYPIDICIKICEKYNVSNALIYLYQRSGDFPRALNLSLKIVDEVYNSVFNIITSDIFKNSEYDEQINNFNNLISQSIDIVESQSQHTNINIDSNDTEKLWFTILNKLYDISINYDNQLKIMSQKRKKWGVIFEEAISDNIKDFLEKMSIYVGVRRILEMVSEKNKTAGYKEFKPLLLKIFETYDNQSFILNSVKRLYINSCFDNIKDFKMVNLSGKIFDLIKCDVCNQNFSYIQNIEDKKVLVFKCLHIMHYYCSYKEIIKDKDVFLCPICRKNEIDNAISSLSLPLMGRDKAFIQNKRIEVEQKAKINKHGIDINRYKRGFFKLRNIDMNRTLEKSSFIEESAKSCIGSYRNMYK